MLYIFLSNLPVGLVTQFMSNEFLGVCIRALHRGGCKILVNGGQ
jgi:hypothetical protein